MLSSYFIVSVLKQKISEKNIFPVLFLLVSFSQVIISFEILSLFSQIGSSQFILLNIVLLILSFVLWFSQGKPIYKPNVKNEIIKIRNAIKLDKVLFVLFSLFVVSLFIGLFNSIFLPITFGDALNYYFTRVTTWLQNGNINHFVTPDPRELIMPVNMEFLYAWLFLFLKKETGTAFFSYISFVNILLVIYNTLEFFKVSVRKRIWAIIIFASLGIIGHMISVPCADIFVGSLLLTGLYLFFLYSKNNNLLILFFSTLATAIAFGTKTTSMIAFPSVVFLMIAFLFLYKVEFKTRKLSLYALFLILNFMIFSSYNFILNFLQFSNPITARESYLINHFEGGFKCYLYNLINYFYLIFDFSGIQNVDLYNKLITFLRDKTILLFGIEPLTCCSKLFNCAFQYNSELTMTKSCLGAIGLFLFFPSLLISLQNCFNIKSVNKNRLYLSLFALAFVFNILLFSKIMTFTSSNSRYLVTFVCLTAPVLAFSYIKSKKNILKLILVYFFFIYLVAIPFSKMKNTISNYFELKKQYPQIKNTYALLAYRFNEENAVYNYFIRQKKSKIALIAYQQQSRLFDIEKLKFNGFHIDKLFVENIQEYDLSSYDYIVANPNKIDSKIVLRNKSQNSKMKYFPNCVYYGQNFVVSDFQNSNLIMVCCDLPFDYFSSLGFKKVTEMKLKEYVILKK